MLRMQEHWDKTAGQNLLLSISARLHSKIVLISLLHEFGQLLFFLFFFWIVIEAFRISDFSCLLSRFVATKPV